MRRELRRGADGAYDRHFRTLGRRLVGLGLSDTVLVIGWEMNGITYQHRCGPDPDAWKQYWKRVVQAMRAVPGQRFRFEFTPNRGRDAIPWTRCYPGDAYVDVIGMDAYGAPAEADTAAGPAALVHRTGAPRRRGTVGALVGQVRIGRLPGGDRGLLGRVGLRGLLAAHGRTRFPCAPVPVSAVLSDDLSGGGPAPRGVARPGEPACGRGRVDLHWRRFAGRPDPTLEAP
ncbi:hypothetical protein SBADM41S_05025 [Streptomyces badius]